MEKLAQISNFSSNNIFNSISCNNIFSYVPSSKQINITDIIYTNSSSNYDTLILKEKNSKAYSELSQTTKMELLAKKLMLEMP